MISSLIATSTERRLVAACRTTNIYGICRLKQSPQRLIEEQILCRLIVRPLHLQSAVRGVGLKGLPNRHCEKLLVTDNTFSVVSLPVRDVHVSSIRGLEHRDTAKDDSSSKIGNEGDHPNAQTGAEVGQSRWVRMKAAAKREAKHYWHGSQLLWVDLRISNSLCLRSLRGDHLMRRESKQLSRTRADLWKLVPFTVLVALPISMITIPIALTFFPDMLPSAFAEEKTEIKTRRRIHEEQMVMSRMLQSEIERTAAANDMHADGEQLCLHNFLDMMRQARTTGKLVPVEEIGKYAKLFEEKVKFDVFDEVELRAFCKFFELFTFGPVFLLRRRLLAKIRVLDADDKYLVTEGLHGLTVWELRAACRKRGMRALGVAPDRLRTQLHHWLTLRTQYKVPLSLLLLSRPIYMPENLPLEDQEKPVVDLLPNISEVQALVLACKRGNHGNQNAVTLMTDASSKATQEERIDQVLSKSSDKECADVKIATSESESDVTSNEKVQKRKVKI